MTMIEISRLILGLRRAGWDGDTINNFLLFIESGDESMLPFDEE